MNWFKTGSGSNPFVIAVVIIFTTVFLFYTAQQSTVVESAGASDAGAAWCSVAAPATTFPADAGSLGGIVDGTSPCWNPGAGAPRNVTFTVSGLTGAPTAVDVDLTFGSPIHTFVGDITAVLIAPNAASHTLFGHTLATTATAFGDSSDLGGPYSFSDNAPAPPNGGW